MPCIDLIGQEPLQALLSTKILGEFFGPVHAVDFIEGNSDHMCLWKREHRLKKSQAIVAVNRWVQSDSEFFWMQKDRRPWFYTENADHTGCCIPAEPMEPIY